MPQSRSERKLLDMVTEQELDDLVEIPDLAKLEEILNQFSIFDALRDHKR